MSAAYLRSFSDLTERVPIDAVVKVLYKYDEGTAGHLVVVGPGGLPAVHLLKAAEVRPPVLPCLGRALH